MRFLSLLLFVALTLGTSASSKAAIVTFDQAELLGMTVYHTTGSVTASPNGILMTAGPGPYDAVNDTEIMTGVAGSNEFLGQNASIYYSLSGADLTALNGSLTAGDIYTMLGWNDNENDNWILGIWYEADGNGTAGDAIVVDSSVTAAGSSAAFNLLLPAGPLDGIGVFIATGTFNDQFHASWQAVPEPASMLTWAGLIGLVGLGYARKRHLRKKAS